MGNKYENVLTKEYLDEQYTNLRRSCLSIAKEIGCDHKTVASYLHYFQIPILPPLYGGRKMAQHSGWKGHGDISRWQFTNIRNNAKTRGIAFEVSIEYLWQVYQEQEGKCALSGVPIGFAHHKKGNASLDRKDSALPYQEGNVWWVHRDINLAKQSLSVIDFIALCQRVVDHADPK